MHCISACPRWWWSTMKHSPLGPITVGNQWVSSSSARALGFRPAHWRRLAATSMEPTVICVGRRSATFTRCRCCLACMKAPGPGVWMDETVCWFLSGQRRIVFPVHAWACSPFAGLAWCWRPLRPRVAQACLLHRSKSNERHERHERNTVTFAASVLPQRFAAKVTAPNSEPQNLRTLRSCWPSSDGRRRRRESPNSQPAYPTGCRHRHPT